MQEGLMLIKDVAKNSIEEGSIKGSLKKELVSR